MASARRTEAADDDLLGISYDIAVGSGRPKTADRVIHELVDFCDRLAELAPMSQLGTSAPDLGEGIRLIPHRRWVIVFRYVDDGVLVLRIADGRQDYLSWRLGEP
jgi:plasmid stabilization system protein ParE